MHDVTEGGILGAIYEMAFASGCGALVEKNKLPTGHIQEQVCGAFNIDPHYAVGAGSMIIAVKKERTDTLLTLLKKEGIEATVAGIFTKASEGINIHDKEIKTLHHPGADPYWDAFNDAIARGLK